MDGTGNHYVKQNMPDTEKKLSLGLYNLVGPTH